MNERIAVGGDRLWLGERQAARVRRAASLLAGTGLAVALVVLVGSVLLYDAAGTASQLQRDFALFFGGIWTAVWVLVSAFAARSTGVQTDGAYISRSGRSRTRLALAAALALCLAGLATVVVLTPTSPVGFRWMAALGVLYVAGATAFVFGIVRAKPPTR